MSDLKLYEDMTTVTLKDGTTVQAPITIDDLMKACNSGTTFIKLDGVMINTSMIAHASSEKTTDIEDFIYRQTKEDRKILEAIIQQRAKAGFRNTIDILKGIMKAKYGEDLY